MKALFAIFITGAILVGTANAQAMFDVPNASAGVTFYDGDPANGGHELERVRMNNSPVAQINARFRDAEFVTVAFNGQSYTLKTFGGGESKNAIYLDVKGAIREDAMTLAGLLDGLARNPNLLEELGN